MISKPIPPLNGLTSLVTSCTIDGIVGILLLDLISTNTKLRGFVFEIKESSSIGMQFKLITLFIIMNQLHINLILLLCELMNSLPPLLPFGFFYLPRLGCAL